MCTAVNRSSLRNQRRTATISPRVATPVVVLGNELPRTRVRARHLGGPFSAFGQLVRNGNARLIGRDDVHEEMTMPRFFEAARSGQAQDKTNDRTTTTADPKSAQVKPETQKLPRVRTSGTLKAEEEGGSPRTSSPSKLVDKIARHEIASMKGRS